MNMGLARLLVFCFGIQTLLGAAKIILVSEKHPLQLKDNVCSPGGTTIMPFTCWEVESFCSLLINIVEASYICTWEMHTMADQETVSPAAFERSMPGKEKLDPSAAASVSSSYVNPHDLVSASKNLCLSVCQGYKLLHASGKERVRHARTHGTRSLNK